MRRQYAAAADDAFLRQETATDREVVAHLRAHGGVDLERQPHAALARSAIAVVARVGAREERRHGVGVGVVQFDAVEAGFPRPRRGVGEQRRQHSRQVADVGEMHVGDTLAIAIIQGFLLRRAQDGG